MRQSGKKDLKLETHLKSQLRRLWVKQKFRNLLQRGKYSNKKEKSRKRRRKKIALPQAQIQKKLKGREGGKNTQV